MILLCWDGINNRIKYFSQKLIPASPSPGRVRFCCRSSSRHHQQSSGYSILYIFHPALEATTARYGFLLVGHFFNQGFSVSIHSIRSQHRVQRMGLCHPDQTADIFQLTSNCRLMMFAIRIQRHFLPLNLSQPSA